MEDLRSLTSAANGAKSQGPTSPEGKAISSRNGEKHGMYSNAVVLHHESEEEFAALRDRYYQRFLPTCEPESDLVDQMIAATWRLRRISAVETAAIDHAMDAQRAEMDTTYKALDPETRTHFAFQKLKKESDAVTGYQRFQAAQIRQYDRAYRNLRLLQTNKISNSEPAFSLTK